VHRHQADDRRIVERLPVERRRDVEPNEDPSDEDRREADLVGPVFDCSCAIEVFTLKPRMVADIT
jgi:hypothetical protein